MSGKHYMFVMWDGGGTVPPELGIARKLIDRGHRVTVLGEATLEDEARAAGCGFAEYQHAFSRTSRRPEDDPIQDFDKKTPLGMMQGARDILMCGRAEDFSRDVRELAARGDFDAIVVDAFLIGAMPGAQATGLPVAAMNPGPDMRPAPGRPPSGMGLKPSDNPLASLRDRLLTSVMMWLFRPGAEPVNAARKSGGLPPVDHPFEQYDELDLYMMLTSQHYDFVPSRVRPNVRYVGGQLDDPSWTEPWEAPNADSPLVLVTLGSTYQGQQQIYQTVMSAFDGLDADALVTLGKTFDPSSFDAPSNVDVVSSAPHSQVLPQTEAAVVHGGHGSVIKALAAGCPMVVVPLGRDQFDNGARVEVAGAGIMVKRPTESNIRAALQRVLDEASYRQNAKALGAKIRAESDRDLAVRELESLCADSETQRSSAAA